MCVLYACECTHTTECNDDIDRSGKLYYNYSIFTHTRFHNIYTIYLLRFNDINTRFDKIASYGYDLAAFVSARGEDVFAKLRSEYNNIINCRWNISCIGLGDAVNVTRPLCADKADSSGYPGQWFFRQLYSSLYLHSFHILKIFVLYSKHCHQSAFKYLLRENRIKKIIYISTNITFLSIL